MHFNFPPKKGTGISRLIPKCPAPALSLLYQMLAYDPDERITADTALRHTYFREIRCARQTPSSPPPPEWMLARAPTFSLSGWLKRERRPSTDFPGPYAARRAAARTSLTTPAGRPESASWRAVTPDRRLCWTWAGLHTADRDVWWDANR